MKSENRLAVYVGDSGNFFTKSTRVLRSSWILSESGEWVQFVLQNCEILHSVRGLYDKNSASWYCFTSDVMYKKYKRLVYTPPDLLASKLVERKKFGLICFPRICFPGLIYCDKEPFVEGLNVITFCPKCSKVLNVITFCPKCNKVLNVITFCPKCNKVVNVITICPKCNKLSSCQLE